MKTYKSKRRIRAKRKFGSELNLKCTKYYSYYSVYRRTISFADELQNQLYNKVIENLDMKAYSFNYPLIYSLICYKPGTV